MWRPCSGALAQRVCGEWRTPWEHCGWSERGSHAGAGVQTRGDWRREEDGRTAAELPNLYSVLFFLMVNLKWHSKLKCKVKSLLLIIYFFGFPRFTHGLHTSFYGSFLPVWFCTYFHTFKYLCSFLFFVCFFLRKWDHAQFTNTSDSGYQSEVCGALGSNVWLWGSAWRAFWRARITCPSRLQSPLRACFCALNVILCSYVTTSAVTSV